MATIKVPKMTLTVNVDGETLTFTSPLAETILAQLRKVVVGQEQIQYLDVATKTFKSFTYCCGDKYSFTYASEEVTLKETEYDCYGFPITSEGDKEVVPDPEPEDPEGGGEDDPQQPPVENAVEGDQPAAENEVEGGA